MVLFKKLLLLIVFVTAASEAKNKLRGKKKYPLKVCLPIKEIGCPKEHLIKVLLPNCQKYLQNKHFGIRCRTKLAIIRDVANQCTGNVRCIFKVSNQNGVKCKTMFKNKAKTHFKCVPRKDFNSNDEFEDITMDNSTTTSSTNQTTQTIATKQTTTTTATTTTFAPKQEISKIPDQVVTIYRNQSSSTKNKTITKSGTSKVSQTNYRETKIVLTYRNNTSAVSKEELLKRICNSNSDTLADGNYEYKENPQCYIQCASGKSMLKCCENGYRFVSLCNKCLVKGFRYESTSKCKDMQLSTIVTMLTATSNSTITPSQTTPELSITKSTTEVITSDDPNEKLKSLLEQNISVSSSLEKFNEILKEADERKISINGTIYNDFIETTIDGQNKISDTNIIERYIEAFELYSSSKYSKIKPSTSYKTLQIMDKLGVKVSLPDKKTSTRIILPSLEFGVEKISNRNITFKTSNEDAMASITIPSSTFVNITDSEHMYFFNYFDSAFFESKHKILTNVIAGTIAKREITNLKEEITIIFAMTETLQKTVNLTCVYWEPVKDVNISGVWQEDGCRRVDNHRTDVVICKCNHLTNYGLIGNFAVVLNPSQIIENRKELEFVSFFGCFLSIFGLGLTLVTFICFKQLRKKIPSKILICLCLSIMALLIVFVAGVNQTGDSGLCHLVAVLLHYFTLTTFCWMSVEAVNLYRTVIKVFSRGDDGTFFRWMFVNAWGVPAVVASISGFLDRRHFFKHDDDIHTSLCVVIGPQFYFALLIPTCLLLLFNFVLFVPILRGISAGEKMLQDSIQDRQTMVARRTKSSFAVLALLGLGWIFAILALGKLKIVFQWLFCIFTTLQGFFIFLMFVVFNPDAKKAWRQLFSLNVPAMHSGSYSNNLKGNDATTTESSIIIKSEHDDPKEEESMELTSFNQD